MLMFFEGWHFVNPEFNTPVAYHDDSIVIYPEIVSGNPLGAKKIVRYLLNSEGVISGRKIWWKEGEFPLSFSKIFRNDCDTLFYPIANPDLFRDEGRHRSGYCLYKGKGNYNGPLPSGNHLEITRAWPASKPELAEIFKTKLWLFSCDSCSSTCLDAALCGCLPILLEPCHVVGELGKFWANDLSEIETTITAVSKLPEVVRGYQDNFDERLNAIVEKIIRHFETSDSSIGKLPVTSEVSSEMSTLRFLEPITLVSALGSR